jgi:putative drug exporter of the RND superfamily
MGRPSRWYGIGSSRTVRVAHASATKTVVLIAVAGAGAATLSGTMSNSFEIPGTESQKAISQLAARFPQADVGGATAQVVFVAPSGSSLTTASNQAAVERTVGALESAPKVVTVTDPYQTEALSADGRYAMVQVGYAVPGAEVTTADRTALLTALDTGRAAGLTVEAGGAPWAWRRSRARPR